MTNISQNYVEYRKKLSTKLGTFVDQQTVHGQKYMQVQNVALPVQLVYGQFCKPVGIGILLFAIKVSICFQTTIIYKNY